VSQRRLVLRIFVDQCVPQSAGIVFREAGHEVVFLRERIPVDSPDSLVAAVAVSHSAILLSMDADFRKIAGRHGVSSASLRSLSIIKLSCRESRAGDRIRDCLGLIEYEWTAGQSRRDRRLFMEIGDSFVRSNR
jgi:predicted nuclease of predicted toxin-antitoxin system